MDSSLTVPKNLGSTKDKDHSPNNIHISDEKVATNLNPEEEPRAMSAPLKSYSGSLFLYSSDPFGGYFTAEGQDIQDEEHYNKFFDLKKEVPINKTGSYQKQDSNDKNDLDLSRQSSSLAEARLSPDIASNQDIMEVFKEGSHGNYSKQHESFTIDAPTANRGGDGKHGRRKKSKSYNSPKKPVMETQVNPTYQPAPMMYPSMMMGQPQYMNVGMGMNMNMNMNMNMMPQEYNYMMNPRMFENGKLDMMAYPVPVMNYTPYGMYPPGMMQVPPTFGNPYMQPMEANQAFNQQKWVQETYKNMAPQPNNNPNINNSNNNHMAKRRSNSNAENNNKPHRKDSTSKPTNKDKDSRGKETANQSQQKKDNKKRDTISSNNAPNTNQNANIQSLNSSEQEHLIENALSLAKDQSGCRLLQQKLELNDPETTSRIFEKVIEKFDTLMVDPFGNYLCQKIAEICTNEQMKRIIEVVSPSIIEICLNPHGTRAVQKLIEIVKQDELVKMLAKSLSADVVGLVKDNHGNHVVQKCLTNMSEENRQFIYDSITQSCVEVSTHKHGCCVMQRCLDFASKKQKNDLIRVIANHTLDLVEDQFGNYVVQYILDMKEKEADVNDIVGESLIGHVVEFSKQKFSSNVIEKCLQLNIEVFRQHFMEVLSIDEMLIELICDQFGNYVIQRCLTNSDEQLKEHILDAIANNAHSINENTFGNKIYTKLSKNYGQLADPESLTTKANSSQVLDEGSQTNSRKGSKNITNYKNTGNSGKDFISTKGKTSQVKGTDKKTGQGGMTKSYRRNTEQNSGNYPSVYQRGPHRHSVGSRGIYSNPMGPEMIVQPNMGTPIVQPSMGTPIMQPGYYMAQPQPFGQYYSYPQMQPDSNFNNGSWQ